MKQLGLKIALVAVSFCWANFQAQAQPSAEEWLQKSTEFARSKKASKISVQKSIHEPWGTKPVVSKGQLVVQGGHFRLEFSEPEKIWVLYDGKTLSTIRFASPDFPGKNKVIVLKVNAALREKDFWLKMLATKSWSDEFKIESTDQEGLKLTPKVKTSLGFKNLKIKTNSDHTMLSEISYSDDVENITTWKLEKPEDGTSLITASAQSYFNYKPNPKLDDVEEH